MLVPYNHLYMCHFVVFSYVTKVVFITGTLFLLQHTVTNTTQYTPTPTRLGIPGLNYYPHPTL